MLGRWGARQAAHVVQRWGSTARRGDWNRRWREETGKETARESVRWTAAAACAAVGMKSTAEAEQGRSATTPSKVEAEGHREIREELALLLAPIRNRKRARPPVKMRTEDSSIALSFSVPPNRGLQALAMLANLVSDNGEFKLDKAGHDSTELSRPLRDGTGSISLLQDHDTGNQELVLHKVKGQRPTSKELEAFAQVYEQAAFSVFEQRSAFFGIPPSVLGSFPGSRQGANEMEIPGGSQGSKNEDRDPLAKLESLGAVVYAKSDSDDDLDWSCLAGYDGIIAEIEDSVLLGLEHPGAYDAVARQTRAKFESNLARAVLFEGPPGTGKTTAARIIAHKAGVPMVYIPIESVMSKWYGESENKLKEILSLCDSLPQGSLVFLDEIDSLATSRDSAGAMHEATRRVLSVLLRSLEGFTGVGKADGAGRERKTRAIVIAATNRKQDLDSALVSRFDLCISFPLPGENARHDIIKRFAKQLTNAQVAELAAQSNGFAGRDIRDMCKLAERRWVAQQLRLNKVEGSSLPPPPFSFYSQALLHRRAQL